MKGELEFEGHKLAEAFDRVLQGTPGYYGVVPIGSIVRGYANEKSDVDIVVLRDKSAVGSREDQDTFDKEICKKVDALFSPSHEKFSFIHGDFDESKVQIVIDYAIKREFDPHGLWLNMFSPAAIGAGIDRMRTVVADKIKALPKEQRELVIKGMAISLVWGETKSAQKISERVEGMDYTAMKELARARTDLWERQIADALRL